MSVSAWLVGCGDDDGGGGDNGNDSGVQTDAGSRADGGGSLPGMDAGLDSGSPPAPPADSGTVTDAGKPNTDAGGSIDAGTPLSYTVTLTAAQEADVCASAGAGATGTATVVLSADESEIDVVLSYSGLSGEVTGAHIHGGASYANGPVVLPFAVLLTSPIKQTFTAADYLVDAWKQPPTFATFVTYALKNGGAYLNLHTAACPGGEIAGQIK